MKSEDEHIVELDLLDDKEKKIPFCDIKSGVFSGCLSIEQKYYIKNMLCFKNSNKLVQT
jgi:hypothetical protein